MGPKSSSGLQRRIHHPALVEVWGQSSHKPDIHIVPVERSSLGEWLNNIFDRLAVNFTDLWLHHQEICQIFANLDTVADVGCEVWTWPRQCPVARNTGTCAWNLAAELTPAPFGSDKNFVLKFNMKIIFMLNFEHLKMYSWNVPPSGF